MEKFNKLNPILHRHEEFIQDRSDGGFISNDIMMKWFNDKYSTSKHLLILYSIAIGLNAKNILEIGGGRSTCVLSRAAKENNGKMTHGDICNINYLLSEQEKKVTKFFLGKSDLIWEIDEGYDFAFLDYFSEKDKKVFYIENEINKCIKKMKKNGVIAIHDVFVKKYSNIKMAIHKVVKKRKDVEYITIPFNYGLGLIRCLENSKYGSCDCNSYSCKKQKIKYI